MCLAHRQGELTVPLKTAMAHCKTTDTAHCFLDCKPPQRLSYVEWWLQLWEPFRICTLVPSWWTDSSRKSLRTLLFVLLLQQLFGKEKEGWGHRDLPHTASSSQPRDCPWSTVSPNPTVLLQCLCGYYTPVLVLIC